ncbi:hypothetical protein F4X88_15105 [Candidatus Poribacteria bacterium]|nr:hypothetical protein [Candidatus Poribacteria bacterium]MYA57614.1 hypothetical protein [Candidatus Poribacteria bacterium]
MKTFKTLLGCFILIALLSGCSVRPVNETSQNASVPELTPQRQDAKKQDTQKADFIIGFNPLRDDPDNPSPHNPLVKKFGDIPEVRTYIRLKQKLGSGIGLNIDEAIELYTAEVHLYPMPVAKAMLKSLESDRRRYKRLGIPTGAPVLIYRIKEDTSDETSTVPEAED